MIGILIDKEDMVVITEVCVLSIYHKVVYDVIILEFSVKALYDMIW